MQKAITPLLLAIAKERVRFCCVVSLTRGPGMMVQKKKEKFKKKKEKFKKKKRKRMRRRKKKEEEEEGNTMLKPRDYGLRKVTLTVFLAEKECNLNFEIVFFCSLSFAAPGK